MTSFLRLIVLSALFISFSSVTVLGQDSTKSLIKTVFKKNLGLAKLNYLGVYIAPEYQFGQVGGAFTSLAGGSIMLQFNKRFAFGMTGFKVNPLEIQKIYLDLYCVEPNKTSRALSSCCMGLRKFAKTSTPRCTAGLAAMRSNHCFKCG